MERLLQVLVNGANSGALYALIAMGFGIVFKATRVVNFAHGQYIVAAGIIAAVLQTDLGWSLLLIVPAVLLVGAALGVGTETVAFRMLKRPDALTVTIGTVAVGILLQAVLLNTTDGASYGVREWPGPRLRFDSFTVSPQVWWNVAIAVLAAVSLTWFFTRTRRGIGLQAAADDRDTAALYGVSPASTALWTFGLAGALGGLAGLLLTSVTLISFSAGFLYGLKGFAAGMLGGLGSMKGALLGGVVIGLAESAVATYLSNTYAPVVAFVVLMVVLVARPTGIFREVAVERV